MVCGLAYIRKLDELTESVLAHESLATRPDQDRAALLGHSQLVIQMLLNSCCTLECQWRIRWRRLEETVKALLVKRAQVNAVNQNGYTPLRYAASKNRHEVAVMLLEGYSNALGRSQGHLACGEGREEESKLLVTQGASIYIENKEEKTPLQATKGGLGFLLKRITE
ncbi:hypothetical protein U0070_023821, partial [Myodes glareolus]